MSDAKQKKNRFAAIAANISGDPSARDELKLPGQEPSALSVVSPGGQGAASSSRPPVAAPQDAQPQPASRPTDARREPPTHSPGLRLNTYEVEMVKRLAEASGHRQQHILRSLLVPALERAVAKLDADPDIFRVF